MRGELPPELSKHFGHLQDIKQKGNDHWTSACPNCGGSGGTRRDLSDRFCMWLEPARYWCRRCGYQGFISQLDGKQPSAAEIEISKNHRLEYLERENKRLKKKVAWLQRQQFWQEWHEQMSNQGREYWYKSGLDDALINIHKLGFTTDRYSDWGGALSIPYLHDDQITTVQYRLIRPPESGDKYRFERGTKATWFWPWPYGEADDVIMVVEGAKKGLVTWRRIAMLDGFTYRGENITILASPQKNIPQNLLPELHRAKRVILLLDPDAYRKDKGQSESALVRNAKAIGVDRCRHVRTVAKIDDMIVDYGLEAKTIQNMVKQASPIPS